MRRSLLEAYVTMINEARADRPRQRKFTPEQIESMYFEDPNYDEKGHFLAFKEDRLVGEALVHVYPRQLTEAGCFGSLQLSVLPEFRRIGIGRKLVEEICEYLRTRNANEVLTEVPATCQGSRRFYEGLGFSVSARWFFLAYDLQKDLPRLSPPVGYTVKSPRFPDDKSEFLKVWNQANEETVLSPEAFDAFLSFPGVRSGYFVGGRECDHKIVGVLSCYIDPDYNERNKVKEGTIEIVGVLQEERRKGIGSCLVAKGLEWMMAEGITTVLAYVYAGNKNSISVFRHLGFKVLNEDLTYRLLI